MALVGVEYVDHFAEVRASGLISDGAEDLTCPYYIANWFGPAFTAAGHTVIEHANQGTGERHMRDTAKFGGADAQYADKVDLFLMITHGNYQNNECVLLFDNMADDWFGHSKQWRFGDGCNLEWLLIFGCQTIDSDHILDHLAVFQRLHLFCGSYGYMYDSFTIDEAGQDTADNLLGGETVCGSWGDGVSDWLVNNHPMVISVELQSTWNNGNVLWDDTVIGSDHFWGYGSTNPDIKPADQYWMGAQWWDGGLYG